MMQVLEFHVSPTTRSDAMSCILSILIFICYNIKATSAVGIISSHDKGHFVVGTILAEYHSISRIIFIYAKTN